MPLLSFAVFFGCCAPVIFLRKLEIGFCFKLLTSTGLVPYFVAAALIVVLADAVASTRGEPELDGYSDRIFGGDDAGILT